MQSTIFFISFFYFILFRFILFYLLQKLKLFALSSQFLEIPLQCVRELPHLQATTESHRSGNAKEELQNR